MHCQVVKKLIHLGSPVNSINICWHIKVCLRLTAVVLEVYVLLRGIHGTFWQLTVAVLSSACKRCKQVLLRCWHWLGSKYIWGECFVFFKSYLLCCPPLYSHNIVFQSSLAMTGNTNTHTAAETEASLGLVVVVVIKPLCGSNEIVIYMIFQPKAYEVCLISGRRLQSEFISLFNKQKS